MTERYLVIKAKGGLGNRMLSAVTGLIYADLSGRVPVIDWRDGVYAPVGTNAYPLLFDTPITRDPADFDGATDVMPAVWSGQMKIEPRQIIEDNFPQHHSTAHGYRKLCVDVARLDHPAEVAVYWSYVSKIPRLKRHLARDARFRGKSLDDIAADYLKRYFTPNARVRSDVARFLDPLPRPIIGAHLRYTDMLGPLDRLKAMLGRKRAELPGAPIFLATDSAKAQANIMGDFEGVRVTPKYLPEDGSHLHLGHAGVDMTFEAENAMIDMWVLGGCDHLIYAKNSTFGVAATLIGRIPPARQVNLDAVNPKVMIKRWLQERI